MLNRIISIKKEYLKPFNYVPTRSGAFKNSDLQPIHLQIINNIYICVCVCVCVCVCKQVSA